MEPMVAFVLFTYNQEAYVRQAVESVLAQDYPRLHIILSDDCSTDGTAQIIEEVVASYVGPHTVEVLRHTCNLGLAKHVSSVIGKLEHDFLVLGAGDDISLPHRVSCLVDEWERLDRAVVSIFSGYELIDERGRTTGTRTFGSGRHPSTLIDRVRGNVLVEGATQALSNSVYRDFGPIKENAVNDDIVLQFRAAMRGGVYILGDPLIKYRKHSQSITGTNPNRADRGAAVLKKEVVLLDRYFRCLKNFEADLETARKRGYVGDGDAIHVNKAVADAIAESSWRLRFLQNVSPRETWPRAALSYSSRAVLRDTVLRTSPNLFSLCRKLRQWTRA